MSTQASGRRQRSAISPRRDEDFPGWYQEVVRAAELASMAHVRGCMVIRPWGYGIWDLMKQRLSDEIRVRGHDDAYFPLFIPLSYLEKEAEHVEGFAKEMAVVTHHRLEKRDGRLVPAGELEEPVVVRPTSETVIGASMAEWVQSYRDLPLKLNQWANVVRWEMRPRVFLRTTEFLWQEGHTAHATEAEAMAETLEMHEMYRTFAEQWLAVPVLTGEKSPSERFPGAVRTYTIEAMMQDGKALQAGTSHYLGQNFARAAGISFTDAAGERVLAHTTSWGMSTRMVGAVVMAHGDDDGLCLPPTLAPHQVVVVPMLRGDPADTAVSAYAERIAAALGTALRVHVDRRGHRPAEKKWQWVKKGAPLLVEVGARDETAGTVTWRNRLAPHEAVTRSFAEFVATADAELRGIQAQLLARARERLAAGLRRDITTRAEAEEFFTSGTGFVLAGWCGSPVCEVAFKPLGVTIRCLPTEERATSDSCLACGRPSVSPAVFAASY